MKAGYSGPLSLLMLIPLANFVVLLIFAFTKWPIEQRLAALQRGTDGPIDGGYAPASGISPR